MTAVDVRPSWAEHPAALRVAAVLADGRSLPTSMLTAETGLGSGAVAVALSVLADADAVTMVRRGRSSYYRLTAAPDPELVAAAPIAVSLRPGTALHAVRTARSCYGHPAGRLGVAITDALRRIGYLSGPSGEVDRDGQSRPSGPVEGPEYRLTSDGLEFLAEIGFPLPQDLTARPCVDWTEQRHHLAGAPGRALLAGMFTHGWVALSPTPRALVVTDVGRAALEKHLSLTRD